MEAVGKVRSKVSPSAQRHLQMHLQEKLRTTLIGLKRKCVYKVFFLVDSTVKTLQGDGFSVGLVS